MRPLTSPTLLQFSTIDLKAARSIDPEKIKGKKKSRKATDIDHIYRSCIENLLGIFCFHELLWTLTLLALVVGKLSTNHQERKTKSSN